MVRKEKNLSRQLSLLKKLRLENSRLRRIIKVKCPSCPYLPNNLNIGGGGQPISKLGLSIRAHNVLHKAGIKSVEDLLKLNTRHLLSLKGCGIKTYREIACVLKKLGLKDDIF